MTIENNSYHWVHVRPCREITVCEKFSIGYIKFWKLSLKYNDSTPNKTLSFYLCANLPLSVNYVLIVKIIETNNHAMLFNLNHWLQSPITWSFSSQIFRTYDNKNITIQFQIKFLMVKDIKFNKNCKYNLFTTLLEFPKTYQYDWLFTKEQVNKLMKTPSNSQICPDYNESNIFLPSLLYKKGADFLLLSVWMLRPPYPIGIETIYVSSYTIKIKLDDDDQKDHDDNGNITFTEIDANHRLPYYSFDSEYPTKVIENYLQQNKNHHHPLHLIFTVKITQVKRYFRNFNIKNILGLKITN